jgi:hypothetical protein
VLKASDTPTPYADVATIASVAIRDTGRGVARLRLTRCGAGRILRGRQFRVLQWGQDPPWPNPNSPSST